ncbi:2-hydroxyisoflavanone dehydratase-like [Lolium perenne]|uniref:2-hydroxyisoflavanone dehydratase-like n=1 Tax=Lolium perenne TaxID=4522 RepID=UPI0021F5643A|nr:2-hydroxyisoflavanone dehydratase-like [Lolium perenne]
MAMHQISQTTCPAANNKQPDAEEITVDLYPFIREYKGGRIERLVRSPFVAASEDAAANHGVATRDVVVDEMTGVSARLFLPSLRDADYDERLPVIMYVHGGSFCTGSAFCRMYHAYARSLAARTGALVVSVDYRLAPEHPVPMAYDDAWAALRWMASFSDPWLSAYGDPTRTFLAGDSVGANIAYNTAVRASLVGGIGIDIEGLLLVHPYFWGVDRLSSWETAWDGVAMFKPDGVDRLWPYVTAGKLGHDDPRVCPVDEEIASLTCRRVLVAVAGKDTFRYRGRQLASRARLCAWADDGDAVTLLETEGEDYCFHLHNPLRASSKILMENIVQFVKQPRLRASPLPGALLRPELHAYAYTFQAGETTSMDYSTTTRRYVDDTKGWSGKKHMARNTCLQIGQGRSSKAATRHGSFLGQVRPIMTNRVSLSATVLGAPICRL